MGKVNIKCILVDSINYINYYIWIYNNKNELIDEGFSNNGNFCFNSFNNQIFKIIIKPESSSCKICKYIYIDSKKDNKLCFKFKSKVKNKCLITINLTDQNYKGLPIEKGEIFLWQNNI